MDPTGSTKRKIYLRLSDSKTIYRI